MCVIWSAMDVLMCTASIWHMCTMSMDRYFTIKYPMKYGRNKTKTMVALKITFVWVVSIAICCPVCIMGFLDYSNVYNDGQCVPTIRNFVIYGSFFAFYVPLTIMVITYSLTIKILCDNQKLMKNAVRQQSNNLRIRKEIIDASAERNNVFLTPNASYSRISNNQSAEMSMSYFASVNESEHMEQTDESDPLINQDKAEQPRKDSDSSVGSSEKEMLNFTADSPRHAILSVSQPNLVKCKSSMLNEATSQPQLSDHNGYLSPVPTLVLLKRKCSSFKTQLTVSHPHLSPNSLGIVDRPKKSSRYTLCRSRHHTLSQPYLTKCGEQNLLTPPSNRKHIETTLSQPHLPSMNRRPLLSSIASNHSIVSLNINKSVSSILELESVKNFGECVSGTSSLNSMLSKGSAGIWSDFEEPQMLQRLSQIESEMDQCLFEVDLEHSDCDVFEDDAIAMESDFEDEVDDSKSLDSHDWIPVCRVSYGDTHNDMTIPPVTISSPPVSSCNSRASNDADQSENPDTYTIELESSSFNIYKVERQTQSSLSPPQNRHRVGDSQQRNSLSLAAGGEHSMKSDDDDKEDRSTDDLQSETLSQTTQTTVSTFARYSPHMTTKFNIRTNGYGSSWKTFLGRRRNKHNKTALNGYCHNAISKRNATNEKKASKVLGIIFAVFVALWTPFFIINVVSVVCPSCMSAISPPIMASIVWFGYMSSLANPVIYTMFNTSFRRAFYRILTCKQVKRKHIHMRKVKTTENTFHTTGSKWNADRGNTMSLSVK